MEMHGRVTGEDKEDELIQVKMQNKMYARIV